MAQSNIAQITPFMHVADIGAALDWFALIGFQTQFRHANYAYVSRDRIGVRLLESCAEDGAPHTPHKGFAYYVDVHDVDAIHAEVSAKLVAADVHVRGPVNQEYGQRELMIRAPDGNVFVFGQSISEGDAHGR